MAGTARENAKVEPLPAQLKMGEERPGEKVFYNSAKARRTCCGRVHYCVACPVCWLCHSRRDRLWQSRRSLAASVHACVHAPSQLCILPVCRSVVTAWTPTPSHPPQGWNKVTNLRVAYSRWEKTSCLGVECLNGRQLDTFDTDIIVDLSAHQTILQMCRGEGDVIIHRLQGDVSDTSPTFVLSDVPSLFDVFQELTFDLAQVNLKELARKGLGKRMGAVVWDRPAGLSTQIRPESI